jgi:hypothetical protein
VSTQELLQVAQGLSQPELDELLARLRNLRAERIAPSMPQEEAELVQQLNTAFPPGLRRRYRHLIAKRRAETLTLDEQPELLQLTEEEERHNARCVEALVKLAEIRGKSATDVMADLGLLKA